MLGPSGCSEGPGEETSEVLGNQSLCLGFPGAPWSQAIRPVRHSDLQPCPALGTHASQGRRASCALQLGALGTQWAATSWGPELAC